MNKLNFQVNTSKISLTAYRAIKLLKMLLNSPCSSEEIIEEFAKDSITERSATKDSLRITINSLKAVGCLIKRPSSKTKYCYVLEEHPFKINFSKKDLKILNKIRDYVLEQKDWKTVIKLNNFYDKISEIIEDGELKDILKYKKPFAKIRPDVLSVIENEDIINKEIIINYASTSKKINSINIIPDKIFCDAGKLYLWAWYFKRNSYSYFNVEKILSIPDIKKTDYKITKEKYIAIYELKGESLKEFLCEPEEKILRKENDKIVVSYNVVNEFKFFQRLLAFGRDFTLLAPVSAKEELSKELSLILERYKNESF